MDEMLPSDHAFESFLAMAGDGFEGDELRMFRFFQRHPGQEVMRAMESAIQAYEKGKH